MKAMLVVIISSRASIYKNVTASKTNESILLYKAGLGIVANLVYSDSIGCCTSIFDPGVKCLLWLLQF